MSTALAWRAPTPWWTAGGGTCDTNARLLDTLDADRFFAMLTDRLAALP